MECHSSLKWLYEMFSVDSLICLYFVHTVTRPTTAVLHHGTAILWFKNFPKVLFLSTDKPSDRILLKYKKTSYYDRGLIGLLHVENNPNTFKKDVVELNAHWQCHSLLLWLNTSHINTLCKYKHTSVLALKLKTRL